MNRKRHAEKANRRKHKVEDPRPGCVVSQNPHPRAPKAAAAAAAAASEVAQGSLGRSGLHSSQAKTLQEQLL